MDYKLLITTLFIVLLATFSCDSQENSTVEPPQAEPTPEVADINKPYQSPNQSPYQNSYEDCFFPQVWFFKFELRGDVTSGWYNWNAARRVSEDPIELIHWLGENSNRIFIVANNERKNFLTREYPMFQWQFKLLIDLEADRELYPNRNYSEIAVDDDAHLLAIAPDWFFKIHLDLKEKEAGYIQ